MRFRLVCSLLPAVTLCAAACRQDTETWGFVATLGNDTTSVERITRTGNRVVSEAVGRSPQVVRRRWEATLSPDGSVRSWKMDTRIANATAGAGELHHEFRLDDGVIRIVRHAGTDSINRPFSNTFARTVPWNAFLYGTFELLFAAARDLPDSTRIGQYFFEGWSEGRVGYARVRHLPGNRMTIVSTGLSGTGSAQLDEQGRMLSYSGQGTTYKQEVKRVADVPDLAALFERFAAAERAQGVSTALSTRDTMRAQVGRAEMIIDYSRPLARGRTLLGGLIPYDRVWRTGANAATHMTITAPLRVAGVALDSGRYTLWTLPGRDSVLLIINAQTGQWGTGYQASHDIARAPLRADTLAAPVEQFTIRVDSARSQLILEWGTFHWSARLQ